jgi:hypothetical protein
MGLVGTAPRRGGLCNQRLLLWKRLSEHSGLRISLKNFSHFIAMWAVSSVVIVTANETWEFRFSLWLFSSRRGLWLGLGLFIVIVLLCFVSRFLLAPELL